MWKFLPYEGKIPPWGGIPLRLGTTVLEQAPQEAKCRNYRVIIKFAFKFF